MPSPLDLFICYARKDRPHCEELEKHLRLLKRREIINDIWWDKKIHAGEEWDREIHKRINSSHIILLIMSVDLFSSTYIEKVEMEIALKRQQAGEAVVIPIYLRYVSWEPFLGELQALPSGDRPICAWPKAGREQQWMIVSKRIEEAANRLGISGTKPGNEGPAHADPEPDREL